MNSKEPVETHPTRPGSPGEQYLPGNIGSGEKYYSQTVRFSADNSVQQWWSPICLSSPSASTEYWSTNVSPLTVPKPRSSSMDVSGANYFSLFHENSTAHWYTMTRNHNSATWCERSTWFEPLPLEGCINRHSDSVCDSDFAEESGFPESIESIPDTPEELGDTLPQDEVDKNTREMTCGPKVEEHFWPMRYQIHSGKLHLYENAIQALIVYARKERQPAMHGRLSALSNELVSRRVGSSSSLTSFLDESRSVYERLWQIASEMQAKDLQRLKEAIWEDSLIIILVFYEILTSKADLQEIMKLRGSKAQFMLDLMQDAVRTHIDLVHLLRGGAPRLRGARRLFLNNAVDLGLLRNVDRASAQLDVRRLIVQLSAATDLIPTSLGIREIQSRSPFPLAGGNFGDIFKAQHQGEFVALKRLRLFQADSDEGRQIRQKFFREALIWKNLDHDYVLPFLGVDSETFPGFFCMVSPWMNKGALVSNKGGPCQSTIPVLLYEIAVGLQYLHSQDIVHGDLRGANILLDDQGHARLVDFGLAVFADGPLAPTNRGGSVRWMAPELLNPESCGFSTFRRTFASDIYAFACVCLELYTGKPPFSEIYEGAVMLKVIAGVRPQVPSVVPAWCQQLITKCWCHCPFERVGTGTIIETIVQSVRKRPRSPQEFGPPGRPVDKRVKL
ncbi:kinase-like domain-containing protein [Mycena vitilis]|nr:kinase-like domain-containing protein [Mycena vitilis]